MVAALTSNGVGTCGPDDNQAQAGHLIAQCVMGERTHTLTSEGSDASEDGTGRGTPIVVHPLALRGRDGGAQLEVGPEGGPYNALRAGDGGSSRQSLVSISYAPDEVAATFSASRDVAQSLTANYGKQPDNSDTNLGPTLAHTDTVVRRLTPLECERLQGYPDGWTEAQADSARYRQLGNSIAVPVFEWVARRLLEVDGELS